MLEAVRSDLNPRRTYFVSFASLFASPTDVRMSAFAALKTI